MNSISPHQRINSFEDMMTERKRLEELIRHQKNIIRLDLDDLKEEVKHELKPAIEVANVVKKFTSQNTRNNTLFQVGSSLLVEILVRKLFAKSGIVTQLIFPNLVKNFSNNMLSSVVKNIAQKRQNGHHKLNLKP